MKNNEFNVGEFQMRNLKRYALFTFSLLPEKLKLILILLRALSGEFFLFAAVREAPQECHHGSANPVARN